MSFRCEKCHKAQPAGTSPIRVVVERREVSYPARVYYIKGCKQGEEGAAKRVRPVNDPGGSGWEIVKEKMLCHTCGRGTS